MPFDTRVSALLLEYLHSYYGEQLTQLNSSAPPWVTMSEIKNDK
jgi:hypothetical protein